MKKKLHANGAFVVADWLRCRARRRARYLAYAYERNARLTATGNDDDATGFIVSEYDDDATETETETATGTANRGTDRRTMERACLLRVRQPARLPAGTRRLLRASHVPSRLRGIRERRRRIRTASVASYPGAANRNSVTPMARARLATVAGLPREARL
jgi:hypothetical protein